MGKFKEWRRRRKWPVSSQLYWLKMKVSQDRDWLSHNAIAKALTERYLEMLVTEWEKVSVEDISRFRERIGLCPHSKKPAPEETALENERAQNAAQAEMIESLTSENEVLKAGMKGDYDLDAWLDWTKDKAELLKEIERLREALKSVLGWRELRSHDEIPIGRIEEICTEALSTNEKPSGGEPKKRCLTDLGYRTPLPDSLLSDDGERRMAMRISPKEGE